MSKKKSSSEKKERGWSWRNNIYEQIRRPSWSVDEATGQVVERDSSPSTPTKSGSSST